MVKVASLRTQIGDSKIELERDYQRQLNEERQKTKNLLDAEYKQKLEELEKKHAQAIEEHKAQSQHQLSTLERTLSEQYQAKLESLSKLHEESLSSARTSAAASARMQVEASLKAQHEKQIQQLIASHRQAEDQMQEHHTRSVAQMEDQIQKYQDEKSEWSSKLQQKLDQMTSDRQGDVGVIKEQVEEILQKLHEREIQRIVGKHQSEMEEMKRQYTLQRDRENAAHEQELERIRKENVGGVIGPQQISKKDHDAIMEELRTKHASELAKLQQDDATIATCQDKHNKQVEALQADLMATREKAHRYENEIKELKEQHKQRITGFVDSQASVLAGIQQHVDSNGKTNVDISTITAQISRLQAIVREQLESTSVAASGETNHKMMQMAKKHLSDVETLFVQMNNDQEHRVQPSANQVQ
ncbi:hypothetical protein K492DRAFT_73238 [Lichtheimia hyalospora FSU 10163]|nr:hypothetical protein K492DRAFT_73238 [Lichtheimia hyalospora FSU 10163]